MTDLSLSPFSDLVNLAWGGVLFWLGGWPPSCNVCPLFWS
jgi:hypothetical protein